MDTEDLVPRLALVGTLAVAAIVYTRRRRSHLKNVQASVASLPNDAMESVSAAAGTVAQRSQSLLESVLDSIMEQALKEVKVVLKDGLKRLDKIVDAL